MPTDADTFDRRPFTARQALGRGLIDRVGYLDDAVVVARQKAGQRQARLVLSACRAPTAAACTAGRATSTAPFRSFQQRASWRT